MCIRAVWWNVHSSLNWAWAQSVLACPCVISYNLEWKSPLLCYEEIPALSELNLTLTGTMLMLRRYKFMKKLLFWINRCSNKYDNKNVTNMSGEENIQANFCCHWGYWLVDKIYFWANCCLENPRQLQSRRERTRRPSVRSADKASGTRLEGQVLGTYSKIGWLYLLFCKVWLFILAQFFCTKPITDLYILT